ncbi:MAG: DUF4421 family protein [Bdellovibrionales bacterium]|nr:DUF4421 family protein [Bdellovibrionales bacterium]
MRLLALFLLAFGFIPAARAAEGGYRPWKIGLSFEADSLGIDLSPKIAESEKLTFRPSQSNYAGVILGYRWLAGTLAFAVPASREIRDQEGQSKYTSTMVTYYVRNWGIELGYNHYTGYLIENSSRLSAATLNGAQYYRLPEMQSTGYGLNFFYVLSPKGYSMPAAFDQSEPQNTTAGSFMLLTSIRHQYFRNDAGLIPAEKVATFGSDGSIKGAKTTNVGVGGGYGVLWDGPAAVFASAFFGLTFGINHLAYDLIATNEARNTGQFNGHFRVSFGLNGGHGFLKASFLMDYFNYSTESIKIGNSDFAGSIAGGVRF